VAGVGCLRQPAVLAGFAVWVAVMRRLADQEVGWRHSGTPTAGTSRVAVDWLPRRARTEASSGLSCKRHASA
jgi:hypothetical protein